jgi:putative tryptophan/tyrosine transport system substrate-binding protein
MRRREFISLLATAVAGWPLAAHAQQPLQAVIGYLGLTSPQDEAEMIESFRKGLREAGLEEGRNLAIEFRFAEGRVNRLPDLAAELVGRNVAVILTPTTVATVVVKQATSTVPIVFVTGSDPIKSGLVAQLNRPGANLTGVSFFTNQIESKRLGLLHELAPAADLIGVLLNANNPFFDNQMRDLHDASRALGLKIHVERASNESEIVTAFLAFAQQKAGGVLVGADPFFLSRRVLIIDSVSQLRLPAIYEWRQFAEAGGLMSYGTSLTDAFRQSGGFVARILIGENPAELPIMQSTKFEFVINLRAARGLDILVPANLSARADDILE